MDANFVVTNEYFEMLEKSKRELNKILKSFFTGQITLNFMLNTMYLMLGLYSDLGQYIQTPCDVKDVLAGRTQNIFYVLCEHIIGVHRSKTIFLTNEERSKLEGEKDYQSELIKDVYQEIKLRPHIDGLIKTTQLIRGDRFLLFPVPYYIAVLESRFLQLSSKSKEMPFFYINIANKTLAVLSLLQDNFADCSYSACRIIIEEYFRGTIFHNCKEAAVEYYKFANYELEQSIGYAQEQEFLDKFNNRVNKNCKNKIEYLHYGWVDVIPDYHKVVKIRPYTFGGLKKFIVETFADDENKTYFELLDYYHNMCNGFTHGSIANSKYPVIHYFDICSMLVNTTVNAYYVLCKELGEETTIDGIDIIAEIKKHYEILKEAEKKKSTENFENYYKNFKIY